jgi:hypothetical protein
MCPKETLASRQHILDPVHVLRLPVEQCDDESIAKRVGGDGRRILSPTAAPAMLKRRIGAQMPTSNFQEQRIRPSV